MNALRHEFDLSQATMLPPQGRMPVGPYERDALAGQWEAVHQAAAAIGVLAQLGRAPADAETSGLPERAEALGGYEYALIQRSVDDLAAIMRPGLRALLALDAQGRDTTAAALTLWREFHAARDAIIAIAPLH